MLPHYYQAEEDNIKYEKLVYNFNKDHNYQILFSEEWQKSIGDMERKDPIHILSCLIH